MRKYEQVESQKNPGSLTENAIGPCAKAAGSYRCPAGRYLDPFYHVERVRSCSMNLQLGTLSPGAYDSDNSPHPEILRFRTRIISSDCFIFLDENPASLNDGWFESILDGSGLNDWPAVNHGNSSSVSFAGGQSELHERMDKFLHLNTSGQCADTHWLALHDTAK